MKSNVLVDFASCVNLRVEALIVEHAQKKELPAKKIFVRPGDLVDSIYYIQKGRTRHYMVNSDGIEKVAYILNDGWFLREGTFVDAAVYGHLAERFSITELPTVLYVIDYECYRKLMAYPTFLVEVLRSSSSKNGMLRREMESMVFDSAKERLRKLLWVSARPNERIDGCWQTLKISYTHQEIAAIIGVNRVTVSRLITEMVRDGEVRIVNKRIQLNADAAHTLISREGD